MDQYGDPAISEAYEIERTVEIHLVDKRVFRLEIVKAEKGHGTVDHRVRYYKRQSLFKAPNGSVSTESTIKAVQFDLWVLDSSLPPVDQHSADLALKEALRYLAERGGTS